MLPKSGHQRRPDRSTAGTGESIVGSVRFSVPFGPDCPANRPEKGAATNSTHVFARRQAGRAAITKTPRIQQRSPDPAGRHRDTGGNRLPGDAAAYGGAPQEANRANGGRRKRRPPTADPIDERPRNNGIGMLRRHTLRHGNLRTSRQSFGGGRTGAVRSGFINSSRNLHPPVIRLCDAPGTIPRRIP